MVTATYQGVYMSRLFLMKSILSMKFFNEITNQQIRNVSFGILLSDVVFFTLQLLLLTKM